MPGLRRGSAAIVGAAESDLGHVADGLNPIDLMAQGIARAAEDAGLRLHDIDGLLCATTQSRTSGLNLSEYLGISPRFIDTTILGGSSFMFHVAHAVAARQWALLNPAAWEKKPLTVEEVLNARMVSYPFTVRDICLVTDGGGAIILTTPERARSLKKPPVYVLGCGQAITHANISSMPNLTVTGALESGRQAYAMAGLAAKDIDVVELYDAVTINTILFLEDLGFCPKGEGGRIVSSGRIAPGGALPVNTNGGGLSCTHPGMYGIFPLVDGATQLRGAGGERQVEGSAMP